MSQLRGGSWHVLQDAGELLNWINGLVVTGRGVVAVGRPSPDSLEIRSEAMPGWAIFLAVILFPVGLLFLLAKQRMVMLIRVTPDPAGGSTVFVSGTGTKSLIQAVTHVYNTTLSDPAPTV